MLESSIHHMILNYHEFAIYQLQWVSFNTGLLPNRFGLVRAFHDFTVSDTRKLLCSDFRWCGKYDYNVACTHPDRRWDQTTSESKICQKQNGFRRGSWKTCWEHVLTMLCMTARDRGSGNVLAETLWQFSARHGWINKWIFPIFKRRINQCNRIHLQ